MKFVIDDSKMLGNRYISKSTILDPDDEDGMRQIPVLTVDATFPVESIGPTCGYCRDCKWWTGRHGDLTGRCLKVLHLDALLQPDGECNIETAPDFGCVQFEPSDAALPGRQS